MKKKNNHGGKRFGAGRPTKTFKYGQVDIFTYRQIQKKLNSIKAIRNDMIKSLKQDIEKILNTNKFINKIEEQLK